MISAKEANALTTQKKLSEAEISDEFAYAMTILNNRIKRAASCCNNFIEIPPFDVSPGIFTSIFNDNHLNKIIVYKLVELGYKINLSKNGYTNISW